ncbi:hypothetical protein BDL97_04G098900 [Sphagnum fallax]|nr:hypothetical protein BDL97_04G098900 [Sphagnum fallax]
MWSSCKLTLLECHVLSRAMKCNLDHGVLLVGYGKHGFAPICLSYKPYWIIKNSRGPMWGDHGYYKICHGHGECGLNALVFAVTAVSGATDYIVCIGIV